jgi:LytS/YehU family sensor histidine kinase
VPALVLQPLVENAIRHAVAPREEGGSVTIGARVEGRGVRVWVADDGPGLNGSANANTGIGLANTRERLQQLYGDAHRFELVNGRGLRVELELPLRR